MKEANINIFIIGDIENYGFERDFQEVWMQKDQKNITGIVLRYYDNFIIYSEKLDMNLSEIMDLLIISEVSIISGKQAVIELLYPLLEEKYSKREMFFSELKDKTKLLLDTSGVLVAKLTETHEIATAYQQISEFKSIYSDNLEKLNQQIASRIQSGEGVHMLIRENGKIVCHGNTTAETRSSAIVGGIFTVPEFRSKGYASKLVSALCKDLLKRKKAVCLFYDNENSGRLFKRLGFESIEKWIILGRR